MICSDTHLGHDEYNALVLENVVDTDGSRFKVECPKCGKTAIQRDYDRVDGGCVNAYESVTCQHCDYHECDDDYCTICEAKYDSGTPVGYDESAMLSYLLDNCLESVAAGHLVEPVVWSKLKALAFNLPEAIGWFDTCFVCDRRFTVNTYKEFVNYAQRKLLDARFTMRLDKKITLAKTL